MYIMYLDDSGSPSNPNEKHFVLAGVIMHESKMKWVNEGLDTLAKEFDPSNPMSIEFHASEIFSRRRGIWKSLSKDAAISTIKNVLKIIPNESRDNKICVVGCVVDKNSFSRMDPVELAFENLCSRFDLYLNKRWRETGNHTSGMIIFDKSASETTIQNLSHNFRSIGTRWNVTRSLHEVPLFVDSKASRGIQLADHVAYALFRRYEHCDLNYFNVIQGDFDADEDRIHGLVHKTYDQCTCPGCLARKMSSNS